MTAFSDPEMIKAACEVEPRFYITKPVNGSQIIATINLVAELKTKSPSIQSWLHEGLGFVEASIRRCQVIAGKMPMSKPIKTVRERMEASCKVLDEMKRAATAELFDDMINHLSIAYYATESEDHPEMVELGEILRLAIGKLKSRVEKYLDFAFDGLK